MSLALQSNTSPTDCRSHNFRAFFLSFRKVVSIPQLNAPFPNFDQSYQGKRNYKFLYHHSLNFLRSIMLGYLGKFPHLVIQVILQIICVFHLSPQLLEKNVKVDLVFCFQVNM